MDYTLYLPAKPYLVKYLGGEVRLSRTDYWGIQIIGMLGRPPKDAVPEPRPDEPHIVIHVPEYYANLFGYHISEQRKALFLDLADLAFAEEALHYIELLGEGEEGPEIQQIIFYFLDKYGIEEEDLASHTLSKRLYRLRKKREQNVNRDDYFQPPIPVLPIPLDSLSYDRKSNRYYFEPKSRRSA